MRGADVAEPGGLLFKRLALRAIPHRRRIEVVTIRFLPALAAWDVRRLRLGFGLSLFTRALVKLVAVFDVTDESDVVVARGLVRIVGVKWMHGFINLRALIVCAVE